MNIAIALPLGSVASLEQYIAQIKRIPLLSAEAEQHLAQRWWAQADLDAARQLVLSQLRLPLQVARKYKGYGLALADLIQEGNLGLMKAVKRFAPTFGVRLATFAVYWVRAEIHEFILRNWRIVKIATTKAQRKLFFNLRKNTPSLAWLNSQEITQLAAKFAVPPQAVSEMEARLRHPDLAFDPEPDADDTHPAFAPADYLAAQDADPVAQCIAAEAAQVGANLRTAVTQLDARAQTIIERRWFHEPKATLHELAAEFGVSAERIRQIEQAALQKLRSLLVPGDKNANNA